MSLNDVKQDYEIERAVLQTWMDRLNTKSPEKGMSAEYQEGWREYLTWVLRISQRMIDECDRAEANGGNTIDLKTVLNDEANIYGRLADEANAAHLEELTGMLRLEETSRREIAASL
jgi:hypothetical protein